jgi:hypothetical protein
MSLRRRFLSAAHQRLLHQLLSGWHRRGTSLLQIGLDSGFSPEFFWQAGFDVTAVDPSPERIAAAREQTGPKIAYVCGHADHLPFDDGDFDCAVLLHHGLNAARLPEGTGERGETPPLLAEALRAAPRGIIALEWNRFSLAGIPHAVSQAEFGEEDAEAFLLCGEPFSRGPFAVQNALPSKRAVWPWAFYSMMRRACPDRRIRLFSSLPLWEGFWPSDASGPAASIRKALTSFNLAPVPLPWGALLGIRVDGASIPLTPAGVLRTAAESLYAANPRREEAIGRSGMNAASSAFSAHERKMP